jgi:hypothetical protein
MTYRIIEREESYCYVALIHASGLVWHVGVIRGGKAIRVIPHKGTFPHVLEQTLLTKEGLPACDKNEFESESSWQLRNKLYPLLAKLAEYAARKVGY